MNTSDSAILSNKFLIDSKYIVLLFIKKGIYAETYRVRGKDGKIYFLKLYNYSKQAVSSFDKDNNLLEIEILKKARHPNIVAYKDSGELIFENKKFGYLVLEFVVGETLSERTSREKISSIYDIKEFAIGILNGLQYLHSLPEPIMHNEITPQNIMLDLSGDIPKSIIIDFAYARYFHQSTKVFNKEGLNLNYVASECFNNIYSPQSDLFSVGAVMYHLLFGLPPWFKDISKYRSEKNKTEEAILDERKKPLSFPKIDDTFVDFDPSIILVLKKALHFNTEIRFSSAMSFIQALNGEIEVEDVDKVHLQKSETEETVKKTLSAKTKGKGFEAIAGMQELKEQLQLDVINALLNPKEYEKYGITIPNGMLLYGPPGCGKTFFSKRFAEEVGFNFIDIKPSSLQSKFVNATQENIATMFEEAEKNAPTIIFIDELDALVPSREGDLHQMHANAVNEFLAQMNDCGAKGIFIIGASNRPEKIDPAILRAGRLDKKVYLPPPDFQARKAMFQLYLKPRPLDFGIDYENLSILTENYVSADIELLVNEASRKALKEKSRISMGILEFVIKNTKPTVSASELKKYEFLRKKLESENDDDEGNKRNPIGFRR